MNPCTIRDRVIEQRKVSAAELAANPNNFRRHPSQQIDALRGILDEVGFAGAALAYYSAKAGGALTLIDGHLRREEVGPEFQMACTILDVDDAEADKILASFDAMTSMAEENREALDTLLAGLDTHSDALSDLIFGEPDGIDQETPVVEQSEKLKAFIDAREKAREEGKDLVDTDFWLCLVFDSKQQKQAFLAASGAETLYEMYASGVQIAERFGVQVPASRTKVRTVRIDKALADLVRKEGV